MAEIPHRYRDIIYDYATYKTDIPLSSERRYFNTILTGIQHECSVWGDGASKVEELPFLELIRIEIAVNISLETLQILGNNVLIKNTAVGDITVNLGTAGIPINSILSPGNTQLFQFNNDGWESIPSQFKIIEITGDGIKQIFFESSDNDVVQLLLKTDSENRRIIARDSADVTKSQMIFKDEKITLNGATVAGAIEVGIGIGTPTLMLSVNEKSGKSIIGGDCIKLTNKTGGASVAGQLVIASTAHDDAVALSGINAVNPIGVFLESGIADGAQAWIVVGGIADVMLDDNISAVHGNWMGTGQAGLARTGASPPAAPGHFEEIGHCLESVAATGAGTFILARTNLHFL